MVRRPPRRWTTAYGAGVRLPALWKTAIAADNNWIENQIRPIALGRSNLTLPGVCAQGNVLLP